MRGKRHDNSVNRIVSLFSSPANAAESINELFAKFFVNRLSFPVLPTD